MQVKSDEVLKDFSGRAEIVHKTPADKHDLARLGVPGPEDSCRHCNNHH